MAGRVYKGGQFCLPYDVANPHGVEVEVAVVQVVAPVRLTIAGFRYDVEPVAIHPEVGSVAYRLDKLDGFASYHVHRSIHGEVVCDCPDFELRRAGTGSLCKHGRALVVGGLVPSPFVQTLPPGTRPEPTPATPPARRRRFDPSAEDFAAAAEIFARG